MKILLLNEKFIPEIGGIERSLLSIGTEMVSRGHDVELICRKTQQELADHEIINGIRVTRLDMKLTNLNILYGDALSKEFDRYVKKSVDLASYDLILVRDAVFATVILKYRTDNVVYVPAAFIIDMFDGFTLKHGLKQFLRLSLRYMRFKSFYKYEINALEKSPKVYTYSENMRQEILKRVSREVTVLKPGLNIKITTDDKVEKMKHKFDENDINFFFIGRLVSFKNIDKIIEAFRILESEGINNAKLYIVGNGDQKSFLEDRAKSMSSVVFLGELKNTEECLKIADYTITASSYETFGLSILESLSHGVPVVGYGSKLTGLRVAYEEMVTDGLNGFVVNEYSVEALAKKLHEAIILRTSNDYLMMQENASKIVEEYNWIKFVDTILMSAR